MPTAPPRPVEGQDIGLHVLVLRCQAGDEQAFARLLDRFGDRTLRYLRGLLGDDAEDAQQEVWISVYRNMKDLANPSAFRTWLFRLTRHRAIDRLRSLRRERGLFDDMNAGNVDDATQEEAPEPPDLSALGAALMAIPPPQREALLLKYHDDLTYEEIAAVVGVPLGTVRTRIHYAKKKLAQLLNQQ